MMRPNFGFEEMEKKLYISQEIKCGVKVITSLRAG